MLKTEKITSLPIEFYEAKWFSFSRDEKMPRFIPIKSVMIDSSNYRYQNGSDVYISRVVKDFLEPEDITAITQAQLSTGNAMGITNVSSEGHYGWEGLISYVSRHIELPIARFYYDNCYLPTAHNTTYLDSVISGTPYAPTYASMSTLNQGSSGPTSGAHNHYMAGDSF